MCIIHRGVQKKQSTTRLSTIIHHHHPSAVSISRSNQNIGSLCAFLLTRSNAKDQIGKRIRREGRQGSQCVAVSLGPVNLPLHRHRHLPHLAYLSFLLPQNHTVSYAKCLCFIVHYRYKPLGRQVSLLSWPSPLHLLSSFSQSFVTFHERLYTPRFRAAAIYLNTLRLFHKGGMMPRFLLPLQPLWQLPTSAYPSVFTRHF